MTAKERRSGGKRPPGGDDKTGYKRPPKSGQFQPGQSGNPAGRPKGARGFKAMLLEELGKQVVGMQDGKRVKITKERAIILKLVNDAATGNARARAEVIAFLRQLDPDPGLPTTFTFKIDRPAHLLDAAGADIEEDEPKS
jgi:hypothetical protein